jgi:hypothetical protein
MRELRTLDQKSTVAENPTFYLLPRIRTSLPVMYEETRLACGQSFLRKQSLFPVQVVFCWC